MFGGSGFSREGSNSAPGNTSSLFGNPAVPGSTDISSINANTLFGSSAFTSIASRQQPSVTQSFPSVSLGGAPVAAGDSVSDQSPAFAVASGSVFGSASRSSVPAMVNFGAVSSGTSGGAPASSFGAISGGTGGAFGGTISTSGAFSGTSGGVPASSFGAISGGTFGGTISTSDNFSGTPGGVPASSFGAISGGTGGAFGGIISTSGTFSGTSGGAPTSSFGDISGGNGVAFGGTISTSGAFSGTPGGVPACSSGAISGGTGGAFGGTSSASSIFGGTSGGAASGVFGGTSGGAAAGVFGGTSGGAASGVFGGTSGGAASGVFGGTSGGAASGVFGGTSGGAAAGVFGGTSGGATSGVFAGTAVSSSAVNVFAQSAANNVFAASSNPSVFGAGLCSSGVISENSKFSQQKQHDSAGQTEFGQTLSTTQLFGKAPTATFGASSLLDKSHSNGRSSTLPSSTVTLSSPRYSAAHTAVTCSSVSGTPASSRNSAHQQSGHASLFTATTDQSAGSLFAGTTQSFLRPASSAVCSGLVVTGGSSDVASGAASSCPSSTSGGTESSSSVFSAPFSGVVAQEYNRNWGSSDNAGKSRMSEDKATSESIFARLPSQVLKRPRNRETTGDKPVSVYSATGLSTSNAGSIARAEDVSVMPLFAGNPGKSVFGSTDSNKLTPGNSVFSSTESSKLTSGNNVFGSTDLSKLTPGNSVLGSIDSSKVVPGRSTDSPSTQSVFENKSESAPVVHRSKSVFGAKTGSLLSGPSKSLFARKSGESQSTNRGELSAVDKAVFEAKEDSNSSDVPDLSLFGRSATKTVFEDDYLRSSKRTNEANLGKSTATSVFVTPDVTSFAGANADGAVVKCEDTGNETVRESTPEGASHQQQRVKRVSPRAGRSAPLAARRRLSSGSTAGSARPSVSESVRCLTSLHCKDVPDVCADRNILLRHFGRFGRVDRLMFNRTRLSAVVHFADHASAEKAKRNGATIHPKLGPMTLYWRQSSGRRDSRLSGPSTVQAPFTATAPLRGAPRSSALAPADSEVLDELASMQGGDAYSQQSDGSKSKRIRHVKSSSHSLSAARHGGARPSPRHSPAPSTDPVAPSACPASRGASGPDPGQRALTAMERYRVLDARDKQLRDKLRRKSGGAWNTDLVGTCPDMCPEKERYMREAKHDINAAFERNENPQAEFAMDHRLAVKKYSRSSADQEAALAHELRTSAGLTLTMDYLVRHVISVGPLGARTDPGDWFEFVWDRTRAVRKDISQQELSGVRDVVLVEKCARFHIYCAAELSHLPAEKFDQKINTENLTKCLQTLKYMYHDLSVRNICCSNEPEFRAYDILLNLNQGDTLREIQTWADWVRESEPVQHALSLYNALSTNNYVRFYRLLAATSYLQSCVMQRYLSQSRTAALDVITRAHCPSKHTVEYPLDELVRLLAFEDAVECADFLQLHGISTSDEARDGSVALLVRSQFRAPDAVPPLPKAPSLIASKLHCSIGEVVNGGPLPVDPLTSYTPQNSFDSEGRLLLLLESADIDGASCTTDDNQYGADNADVNVIFDQLINDVIRRVCSDTLVGCRFTRRMTAQLYLEVQSRVLPTLIRCVCEEELQSARELRDQQMQLNKLQKQRDAAIMSVVAGKITMQLIEETCSRDVRRICSQLLHQLESAANTASFHRGCEQVGLSLFESQIYRCSRQIGHQVWQGEIVRENHLFEIASLFERSLLLRHFWRIWRERVVRRRRWRLNVPPLSRHHSVHTALQLLGGDLNHARALTSSVTFVERSTEAALCRMLLSNRVLLHSVSIKSILYDFLSGAAARTPLSISPPLLLWKLVLFSPTAPCECGVSDWLRKKFTDQSERLPNLESDSVLQSGEMVIKNGTRVRFIVRAVRETKLCAPEWQGTSAVLVASGCESCANELASGSALTLSDLPSDVPTLLVCTEPIRAVLDQREWPIVDSAQSVDLAPPIDTLATPIRRAVVIDLKNAFSINNSITQCVLWLFARRSSLPDSLAAGKFPQLLERVVFDEVFRRYRTQRVYRRSRRRVEPSPASLVSLYNAVVVHLSEVLSSDDLQALWWPPPELQHREVVRLLGGGNLTVPVGWNSHDRLTQLKETVLLATLPEWTGGELNDPVPWQDCCRLVTDYGLHVAHDDPAMKITLSDSLASILSRWKSEVLRSRADELDECHVHVYPAQLPWIAIITCCIQYCISRMTSSAPCDLIDCSVYYLRDQLTGFSAPDEWLRVTSALFVDSSMSVDEPCPVIVKRRLSHSEDSQLDDSATQRSPLKLSEWELKLKQLITEGETCLSDKLHVQNGTNSVGAISPGADSNHTESTHSQLDEKVVTLMDHLSAERRVSSLWTSHLEELVSMREDSL